MRCVCSVCGHALAVKIYSINACKAIINEALKIAAIGTVTIHA